MAQEDRETISTSQNNFNTNYFKSQRCSPTIPSNTSSIPDIKITNSPSNTEDSSVSDSDEEEERQNNISDIDWAKCQLDSIVLTSDEIDNYNNSQIPQIEAITVQNSSDVTFGNKTFINGQNITINGCVHPNKDDFFKNTSVNYGYTCDDSEGGSTKISHDKSSLNSDKFLQIKNWNFSKRNLYALVLTTIMCMVILSGLLVYFTVNNKVVEYKTGDGDESRHKINSSIGTDLITGNVLRLIDRDHWLAQPPNADLTKLNLPAKYVVITHTATEECKAQAECTLRTRLIQTFHMESNGWDDIGYNFLIGGDGAIYEGRGWDKQGAHTKGYNYGFGIAYIGTFNNKLPNDKQLNAGKLLLEEGVRLGKLIPDYKLYAHRQLIPSESPGETFYALIKTWPHWSTELPIK